MKLKDWADKQGIAYLTAYRWFKAGELPVKAYQTESGTIIVQDDAESSEKPMASNNQQSSDIMSLFLKKTVEFSKSNASVEDFAAYVLSNFSLKLNGSSDSPKYSKVKPKSEDVQKHFQQFLKPKGEKPKPNMFVAESETLDDLVAESDNMTAQELVDEIQKISGSSELTAIALNTADIANSVTKIPEMQDLIKDLSASLAPVPFVGFNSNSVTTYDSLGATGGVVVRNVDVTPQSINYTSSTNSISGTSASPFAASVNSIMPTSFVMSGVPSQPSTEEITKAHQALNKVAADIRLSAAPKARRGRKPSKKSGKK